MVTSFLLLTIGNSSPAVGCRVPSSSKSPSPPQQQQQQQPAHHQHHPHNIHIISYDKRAASSTPSATINTSAPTNPPTGEQPQSIAPGDNYSYVQLTAVHDFSGSFVPPAPSSGGTDDSSSGQLRRDSIGSLKKRSPIEVMGSMGGGGEGEGGGLNVAGRPLNKKDATKMKLRLRCRLVDV